MNVAEFLENTANLYVSAVIAKKVIGDLAAEMNQGAKRVEMKAEALIRKSPYEAAGVAMAVGMVGGLLLARWYVRRAALR